MENIILFFFCSFVRVLNYQTHIYSPVRDVCLGPSELSVLFLKFPDVAFFSHLTFGSLHAGEVLWLIKTYNDVTIAGM